MPVVLSINGYRVIGSSFIVMKMTNHQTHLIQQWNEYFGK